jgi:hypothetical protein
LEFAEFSRIVRFFEPEYFRQNRKTIEKTFNEFAVNDSEGERVISNQGFVQFANHAKLFGQRSHENFLNISKQQGYVCYIEDLLKNWNVIKNEFLKMYVVELMQSPYYR